jgi:DNA-binding NtrC family response regulator
MPHPPIPIIQICPPSGGRLSGGIGLELGIREVYVLRVIQLCLHSAYPVSMSQRDLHDVVHAQILVVDDEAEHADTMAEALRRLGHVCTIVTSAADAEEELKYGNFDVVITDLSMESEDSGMKVLACTHEYQPDAEAIMVTAHGDIATAKAALQSGAYDFIEKPLDLDVFRNLVQRASETVRLRNVNTKLQDRVESAWGFEGIIGDSPAIRKVISMIRQVGPSMIPVLITGESGTGKELVAKALHNQSKRAGKRYVTFNCAGQSESLLEDQLFGHARGAFTGAEKDREGVFEYADHGTLFLDEIGDMPMTMQSKLLRVLESGEVIRLGTNAAQHVDVRFVSATNRDLKKLIDDDGFREDLFFRINGAEIRLPPLRERREDIPLLINHAAGRYAAELERPAPDFTEPAMMRLLSYNWPGNVRQLFNVVQRMIVMTEGNHVDVRDVPDDIRLHEDDEHVHLGSLAGIGLDRLEKEAIRQTLLMTGANREQTAEILGIGERTLYRKLKEYGLK